jgi:spore maturation protein CgeB
MLRVLYVGQLWEGGTCLERARVLGEQGWKLIPFDITPYLTARSRVARVAQNRLLLGPDVSALNRDLLARANRLDAIDVVWIDKGRWVFSETLETLRLKTTGCFVHYTPDPVFTRHTSRHFERAIPLYDLLVTTKRYELHQYREAGARQVLFTWQGIDDRFARNDFCGMIDGLHRRGVVFIGHRERHYSRLLASVAKAHAELKICGPGWETLPGMRRGLAERIEGGALWGEDYVNRLARARIALGLLSKYYPDQFTTRSFEIPAAGTLLIAERTAQHEELFEEGTEAEFFSSAEELSDKIGFYLRNDAARRRIAEKGRSRTLECYHWRTVLAPAMRAVDDLMLPKRTKP